MQAMEEHHLTFRSLTRLPQHLQTTIQAIAALLLPHSAAKLEL